MRSSVANAIEMAEARVAERRAEAAKVYRELLLRSQRPEKGDEQRLLDVAAVLGRGPSDLSRDYELVEQIRYYTEMAGQVGNLTAERIAKNAAVNEMIAWVEKARESLEGEIRGRLLPVQAAQANVEASYRDALQARGVLVQLHDRWTAIETGQPAEEIRAEREAQNRRQARQEAISTGGPLVPGND